MATQRWDWNTTGEEAEGLGWVSEPEVVGPRRSLEGLWFYFKESGPLGRACLVLEEDRLAGVWAQPGAGRGPGRRPAVTQARVAGSSDQEVLGVCGL